MLIKMSGAKLNHQQQNTTITTNNTLNDLNTLQGKRGIF